MTQTELISHNQWRPSYLSQWQVHSQLNPKTSLSSLNPPQPHPGASTCRQVTSVPSQIYLYLSIPSLPQGPHSILYQSAFMQVTTFVPSILHVLSLWGESQDHPLARPTPPGHGLAPFSLLPGPSLLLPSSLEWPLSLSSVTPVQPSP